MLARQNVAKGHLPSLLNHDLDKHGKVFPVFEGNHDVFYVSTFYRGMARHHLVAISIFLKA